jgi:UvrB/uvrC motif
VIQLLQGDGEEPISSKDAPGVQRVGQIRGFVVPGGTELESRLSAIEQRVGTAAATADLDQQIAQVQRDKQSAIDAQDFEQAASLRGRERLLLADKTARQQQWEANHPDLASLAEQVKRLSGQVERLHDLLRQHGIEPEDKPA